jgi:serine/threonine protein kinase
MLTALLLLLLVCVPRAVCAEADIMRRLRHPCLTLFMGLSLEPPSLCIVTELVHRGSLFDILQEESTGFTWRRAVQIMTDIASGLAYLHSFSPPIIHRDLKSLNVLVTSNWRGKVADFGMSRFQSVNKEGDEDRTMTQCGRSERASTRAHTCMEGAHARGLVSC